MSLSSRPPSLAISLVHQVNQFTGDEIADQIAKMLPSENPAQKSPFDLAAFSLPRDSFIHISRATLRTVMVLKQPEVFDLASFITGTLLTTY